MVRNLVVLFVLLMFASCQPGGNKSPLTSGPQPVSVSLGAYTTAGFSSFFISDAHAAVSDLRLCFKRMRLKKSITDIDDPLVDENVDLNLGQVSISTAGTNLGVVNVPADTYFRVEFDLEPACAAKSLNLSNDFGVFSSGENIKIKFDGVFVVNGAEILQLGIQDILNAANAYNGVGSLKTAFESVSGTL